MSASMSNRSPRPAWSIAAGAALSCVTLAGLAAPALAGPQRPAGIIVFPRVEVDTTRNVDTTIEISNTRSDGPVTLFCYHVDGLGHCSNTDVVCRNDADCPFAGTCIPTCTEQDFIVQLTPNQAIRWRASQGLVSLPLPANQGAVPPVPTDPFFGELRCVESDGFSPPVPAGRNDLIGTATIMHSDPPDAASYAAIGIESTGTNNGDNVLCLGANESGLCAVGEYARCPGVLVLNHVFEGATVDAATVSTDLTLVPCSERFDVFPIGATNTVQVIVFNEFEERLCTTLSLGCIGDIHLADSPIFSVGLQGSLVGQTRMRAVLGNELDTGHAVVGVSLARYTLPDGSRHSSAHNLQRQSDPEQADVVRLPVIP